MDERQTELRPRGSGRWWESLKRASAWLRIPRRWRSMRGWMFAAVLGASTQGAGDGGDTDSSLREVPKRWATAEGRWSAEVNAGVERRRLVVEVSGREASATLFDPITNAGVVATDVRVDGTGDLEIDFAEIGATFAARVSPLGISGEWVRGETATPLRLRREPIG